MYQNIGLKIASGSWLLNAGGAGFIQGEPSGTWHPQIFF